MIDKLNKLNMTKNAMLSVNNKHFKINFIKGMYV